MMQNWGGKACSGDKNCTYAGVKSYFTGFFGVLWPSINLYLNVFV